jgi:hypothetical protein
MHTTDECHSHADFEYLQLRLATVCLELAPVRPVHGAFHDAPHASAIRSRSLEEVFSPTSGRDFENLFSSGSPLTSLSLHWLAHHARATVGSSSAEIAFPAFPVKRKRLARPEVSSIEDDAGRPATPPLRVTPVFREVDLTVSPPRFAFRRPFARRGLPLWASPRSFELVPVRECELARLWARRRRSISATRYEVQTHRAIASSLARVLAEARHALLGRSRRLRQEQCSRGCERRHQSLSRLGPCGIALAGCAGRGHRVRGLSRPLKDEQSPSSTRLEHPVVTDACVRALVCPSLRVSRRPILKRPPREGRTRRGGPECFPSPGPIHIGEITRPVRLDRPLARTSEEGRGRPTPLLPFV